MGWTHRARRGLRRIFGGSPVTIWYDQDYRLPLPSLESQTGVEPRRADFVAWFLLEKGALPAEAFRSPEPARYEDLALVHTPRLLESLTDESVLARIFAADPAEISPAEVLRTVRAAAGGTMTAAWESLSTGRDTLNLLGGFHHAAPDAAGGICPVNDIAIAVASLRRGGFQGGVLILDLDAHPPDGTARCFSEDPTVWIGSLSGADWGSLPRVEETALGEGSGDGTYLRALSALLDRLPEAEIAFVVAGGDVLAGDRMGHLGLTLAGARERDARVGRALTGTPTVWLPGGGYHRDSWKVLAQTALLLAGAEDLIDRLERYDPLARHYRWVSQHLAGEENPSSFRLTEEDLEEDLGFTAGRRRKILGELNAAAVEFILFRYGILSHLERLGFSRFRVEIEGVSLGDRVRLFGRAGRTDHLLFETVLEKKRIGEASMLYCHWLTLQDPRGAFSPKRPKLPGQEHPGLGLAREAGELLAQLAERLGLDGVAYRPAWYHTAYAGRYRMRFVDPARQGRFEALLRDLGGLPLLDVTTALSERRVTRNGAPYDWEADEMALWVKHPPEDAPLVEREREGSRFALLPAPAAAAVPR